MERPLKLPHSSRFETLNPASHELLLGPNDILVMARVADVQGKLQSTNSLPLLLGVIRDVNNSTLEALNKQRNKQENIIDDVVQSHSLTMRSLEMYCLDHGAEPFLYRANASNYFASTSVVMGMAGANCDENFIESKTHERDIDHKGTGTQALKNSVYGTLGYLSVLPARNPSKSQLVYAQPKYEMMDQEGQEQLCFYVLDESGIDQNVVTSISFVPNESLPDSNLAVLNTSTAKLKKQSFVIKPKNSNSSA